MDILLIILLLAVFLLPSFFMMRSQRKRQQQVAEMQSAIQAGDRIVTVSGFHATVVNTRDTELDLELAPGTVVTMERAGVMRKVESSEPTYNAIPGSAGEEWKHPGDAPRTQGYATGAASRPEDHPENQAQEWKHPGDAPQDHPESTDGQNR